MCNNIHLSFISVAGNGLFFTVTLDDNKHLICFLCEECRRALDVGCLVTVRLSDFAYLIHKICVSTSGWIVFSVRHF